MLRIFALTLILTILGLGFACSNQTGGGATPTEAYKNLYAAVKSKDTEAIKRNLTKKTLEFGAMAAGRSGTTIERVYENGFTESTFAPTLPTIRDERINGNMGAIEVWSAQKSTWEDLPFILEDGVWKLAVGELFSGAFKSPGKARDEIQREAANAMAPPAPAPAANANANRPKPIVRDIPAGIPTNKK